MNYWKRFISTLSVAVLVFDLYAQDSAAAENKVYFDASFRRETENTYVMYYGIPRKISNKLYEVTFFTLNGYKVAMGEYQSDNFKYRHGLFVRFNGEEKIVITANYKNGMLHGIFQRYHDNGVLADSGRMQHGMSVGLWKSWHSNGQLRELKTFALMRGARGIQFPIIEKEYISYYPNGNTDDSGYVKNNQRSGVWVEWLQQGEVRSIGEYKNGWRRGIWRYYDSRGKLLYMRRFSKFRYDDEGELIELKKSGNSSL